MPATPKKPNTENPTRFIAGPLRRMMRGPCGEWRLCEIFLTVACKSGTAICVRMLNKDGTKPYRGEGKGYSQAMRYHCKHMPIMQKGPTHGTGKAGTWRYGPEHSFHYAAFYGFGDGTYSVGLRDSEARHAQQCGPGQVAFAEWLAKDFQGEPTGSKDKYSPGGWKPGRRT